MCVEFGRWPFVESSSAREDCRLHRLAFRVAGLLCMSAGRTMEFLVPLFARSAACAVFDRSLGAAPQGAPRFPARSKAMTIPPSRQVLVKQRTLRVEQRLRKGRCRLIALATPKMLMAFDEKPPLAVHC